MNAYFEKIKELKNRAEQLRYNDNKELDDITRKSKMCVENLFPIKPTYISEVDKIKFHPTFYVDGMGGKVYTDAWENGKQELINYLDTRIEEAKLKVEHISTLPKEKIVIKEVHIENKEREFELEAEVSRLLGKHRLWKNIDLSIFVTIAIAVVGGTFALGYYLGNNHFDKEKLELYNENQHLKVIQDSLSKFNSKHLLEKSKGGK
jgi:hypothetical protein